MRVASRESSHHRDPGKSSSHSQSECLCVFVFALLNLRRGWVDFFAAGALPQATRARPV